MTEIRCSFYIEGGCSSDELAAFQERLAEGPNVKCFLTPLGPLTSPQASLMVSVPARIRSIAGRLESTLGRERWRVLQEETIGFFRGKTSLLRLILEFQDCSIILTLIDAQGNTDFELIDAVDAITADICQAFEEKRIPPHAFYLKDIAFSPGEGRWLARQVTDAQVLQAWHRKATTGEWEAVDLAS